MGEWRIRPATWAGVSLTVGVPQLGMSVPQNLAQFPDARNGRVILSPERVDALGADVVVVLPNGGTRADLEALPGFDSLPSVMTGGLAVVDYPTVVGLNSPSRASVAYSLDRIAPELAAVGGPARAGG